MFGFGKKEKENSKNTQDFWRIDNEEKWNKFKESYRIGENKRQDDFKITDISIKPYADGWLEGNPNEIVYMELAKFFSSKSVSGDKKTPKGY